MPAVGASTYHFMSCLRAWDFSSLDVLRGRLLDQCYEGIEQWAYRNLWPVVEQAVERQVIGEPVGVVLERTGEPLRFPEDRNILIAIDAWIVKRRLFVFECVLYRLGRRRMERFARVFLPIMQCRIEDPETRTAVPEALSEAYSSRVAAFDGDVARIVNRYNREVRAIGSNGWLGPLAYERFVIPELCEFTDMAAFMNHAGHIASEGRELMLQHLRSSDPASYRLMLRSLALPMKALIIEIKNPLWHREPMEVRVRACASASSFHFDFEIVSVQPKRLCERMLITYASLERCDGSEERPLPRADELAVS